MGLVLTWSTACRRVREGNQTGQEQLQCIQNQEQDLNQYKPNTALFALGIDTVF